MPREKANFRDTYADYKGRGFPDMLTKKEAMAAMGVGHSYFERLIREKEIKLVCGRVPLGDLARISCGK